MRLILPILALMASAAHADSTADAPKVVTDIAPIHSLVAQVMEGIGTPDVLVSGAASPHDFQFTFVQAEAVQNADLLIWVGPGLTPWLDEALTTLSPDAPRLTLLETEDWGALELRELADFGGGHDGHDHDHDHGDADHAVDPHAWLDPQVSAAWVRSIADMLQVQNPENAALYEQNAQDTIAELAALSAEIQALLDVPAQPFLVPHDAYQYFGARFGHPARAAISLSDAAAPTPDQIADLQTLVAQDGVVCVLSDAQARPEWSDLVRDGTDARTALADPMGGAFPVGPDHYGQTMRAMAQAYAECIGGPES